MASSLRCGRRACVRLWRFDPPARQVSDTQNREFGIGEIAEPRTLRALEIFWLAAPAEDADEPRYRAVRVDNDDRPAIAREVAAERSGKAREVGDIAAIDELRAGYNAFDEPWAKDKRIGVRRRRAPQTEAAMFRMLNEHLL